MHSTHVLESVLHTGVVPLQGTSVAHSTQVLAGMSHSPNAGLVQVLLSMHATQVFESWSQAGCVGSIHSLLVVHSTHALLEHTGAAGLQSLPDLHSTQDPSSQRGAPGLSQSLSSPQALQVLSLWQLPVEQSVSWAHSTQVTPKHTGLLPLHSSEQVASAVVSSIVSLPMVTSMGLASRMSLQPPLSSFSLPGPQELSLQADSEKETVMRASVMSVFIANSKLALVVLVGESNTILRVMPERFGRCGSAEKPAESL